MKEHKKTFDAVQSMRDIRDRLSERFKHLSFAEQKRYMRERLGVRSPSAQNMGSYTEMISNRKKNLLAELAESQKICAQLSQLNHAIPPGFFERILNKIEAEAESSRPLKLPVLFFFLVRCDLQSLLSFDHFLGRLKQSHRKREFPNLLRRLLEEESYRNAAGAIFEVEILAKLLDAQDLISVTLYPRIPGSGKKPEASVSLDQKTVYVEATVLSQSNDQEEIWDIGAKSLHEYVLLSDSEKERLGISSIQDGVIGGVGDLYEDALRVLEKLDKKRKQLAPQNPNIICLGLVDLDPTIGSVEWAMADIFSGSPTMAQKIRDRHKQVLEAKRATMTAEQVQEIEGKIQTREQLVSKFQAEPRLSGVLTFWWSGTGFSPQRAFRNPSVNPLSSLTESEWRKICDALGFQVKKDNT